MFAQQPHLSVHSAQQKGIPMLDHLVHYTPEITAPDDFVELEKASTDELLAAQVKTADWLKDLGVPDDDEVAAPLAKDAARQAFGALASAQPTDIQHQALSQLKTPAAVRHLTGMLTAYDWEFVTQAKELRGYTVAKLLEETEHTNPHVRLKALALLGKVTEVGLFTERIEVKKTDMSDAEIEQRIKDKLARFMNVTDVSDVEDVVGDATPADEPPESDQHQPA